MQPEESRRAAQLQPSASALGQLAQHLAAAKPQQAKGSDSTGWVQVLLGPDGLPTDIRVREGWQQRVDPAHLAGAVVEANRAAMQQAMQAWSSAMQQDGWWRRQAELQADTVATGHLEAASLFGRARDSNELAEEALNGLQKVQARQAPSPAPDEGQDDDGHVIIEIGPGGLTACTIDPDWARHHHGSSISAGLSTALRRALAKRSPQPPPPADLDALLGDALATLNSLTAHPDQGGDR